MLNLLVYFVVQCESGAHFDALQCSLLKKIPIYFVYFVGSVCVFPQCGITSGVLHRCGQVNGSNINISCPCLKYLYDTVIVIR